MRPSRRNNFGVRRFIAAFFPSPRAGPPRKKAPLQAAAFWSGAIHRRFLSFPEGRRPAKESGVETPHSKKPSPVSFFREGWRRSKESGVETPHSKKTRNPMKAL